MGAHGTRAIGIIIGIDTSNLAAPTSPVSDFFGPRRSPSLIAVNACGQTPSYSAGHPRMALQPAPGTT